jgi:hypothetical protein
MPQETLGDKKLFILHPSQGETLKEVVTYSPFDGITNPKWKDLTTEALGGTSLLDVESIKANKKLQDLRYKALQQVSRAIPWIFAVQTPETPLAENPRNMDHLMWERQQSSSRVSDMFKKRRRQNSPFTRTSTIQIHRRSIHCNRKTSLKGRQNSNRSRNTSPRNRRNLYS